MGRNAVLPASGKLDSITAEPVGRALRGRRA
ncbi:hypothetical protein J113_12150 [Mycobacterium tuberculosis CAS/NITR204]|uniref:Uncharacterized protein n=1 Tax=Mycobacterium tuberculosis CAS/NITR204 TaxID=1310114 RepID=R4MIB2_MYCTX|nr:hypothetical protein J113_12150 [Mycobacterium tuberculosis CAS/NITR204]